MEEKLLDYMKNFDFIDMMGFARLLKVDESIIKNCVTLASTGMPREEALSELVIETVYQFGQENRKKRKELLKLARDLHKYNADFDRQKDNETSPNIEVISNGN